MTIFLGDIASRLVLKTEEWFRGFDKAESRAVEFGTKMQGIGNRMASVGKRLTLAITLPVVALGVMATKHFMDFEAAMRDVNTIAKQSEVQFQRTSKTVLNMARELGQKPLDLAEALYDINSASFKADEGLTILRASAIAGVAGISNTATAAKALAGALNAYGMRADQVGEISDIMFRTIEKGVIRFDQIAEHMGETTAKANGLGISFGEIGAAVATMTRGNIPAGRAFTKLNRLLDRFIKGGKEMDALFSKTAAGSAVAMLQTEGLGKTMQFLADETGGSAVKLRDLGFRMRSFDAALSLTRQGGQAFASDIQAIAVRANNAGATMRAFQEQTKALRFQWRRLTATIQVAYITLGRDLAPTMKGLIGVLRKILDWFLALEPATRRVVIITAALAATIGPLLLIFGTLIAKIAAIAVIVAKLPLIIGLVVSSIGPMILMVLKLTAIVVAAAAAFAAIGFAIVQVAGKGETFAEKWNNIKTRFISGTKDMLAGWRGWVEGVVVGIKLFLLEAERMGRKFIATIDTLSENIAIVLGVIMANFDTLMTWIGDNWLKLFIAAGKIFNIWMMAVVDGLKALGTSLINFLKDPSKGFQIDLSGLTNKIKDAFKGIEPPKLEMGTEGLKGFQDAWAKVDEDIDARVDKIMNAKPTGVIATIDDVIAAFDKAAKSTDKMNKDTEEIAEQAKQAAGAYEKGTVEAFEAIQAARDQAESLGLAEGLTGLDAGNRERRAVQEQTQMQNNFQATLVAGIAQLIQGLNQQVSLQGTTVSILEELPTLGTIEG